jgi:hypothetical protein
MSAKQFSGGTRAVVCESLNMVTASNLCMTAHSSRHLCVLSVCGGVCDEFTKTVVEWACRARQLTTLYLLMCGPSKSIDSHLCETLEANVLQHSTAAAAAADSGARTTKPPGAKIQFKRQTNMPSEAQWRVLRPQIVLLGEHYWSELWCVKNYPDQLLFPAQENVLDESFLDQRDSDADDDADADNENSNSDSDIVITEQSGQRNVLRVEKPRRPTLYRTEIYRRAMLMHTLQQVALHRPKIVFVQNIFEPSRQSERRRKDQTAWTFVLELFSAFASECAYRVRPMGFELRDVPTDEDDFPARDVWCNGVYLERIDNGFECISRIHYEMALYSTAQVQAAMAYVFYDHVPLKCCATTQHELALLFYLDQQQLFPARTQTLKKSSSSGSSTARRALRRRKSATLPVQLSFPAIFSRALAYYSVAQALATLE